MQRGVVARAIRWMKGMMLKHMPLMITCREFEDFILAYLEGELPEHQRFVFDLHIKVCRECRDYLSAYELTTELSKRAYKSPDQSVPYEVPEDLIKAILAAKRS